MGIPSEIHKDYIGLSRRPVPRVPSNYDEQYLHNFLKGCNFLSFKHPECKNVKIPSYSVIVWSFQFLEILKNLRKRGPVPAEIADSNILENLYPGIKYIYLYRDNKLAQSVSIEAARQSNQWLVTRSEQTHEFKDYKYNFGVLAQELIWRLDGEVLWNEIFEEHQIKPLPICYEDFIADMHGTVIKIAEFLNLHTPELDEVSITEAINHWEAPIKQSHPIKDEWNTLLQSDLKRLFDHFG